MSFMDMLESPDSDLDRELKQIENLGEERGADTASLFSHMESVLSEQEKADLKAGKYTYLNPKKEPVPADYIKQVVLRGTGFVGGKKRVYDIMKSEFVRSERVKRIKNEYGTGGAGWPMEGYGLHGYDTFQAKGIRFQWRDEEGEKEGYANWNAVEEVISALVLTGEYYTPEPMSIEEAIVQCKEYNAIDDTDYDAQYAKLKEMLGSVGSKVWIAKTFNCDNGKNIYIGNNFTGNYNLTILDIREVYIGDNVMIGPNTLISTVNHPLTPMGRRQHLGIAKPVKIGNDVWIGGNVTILPGVTIGNNVVVAAGAVVTKDISDNCQVGGIPAR